MVIVDTHVHFPSDIGDEKVEALVKSGVLNRAWLLSLPILKLWGGDERNNETILKFSKRYPDFFYPF